MSYIPQATAESIRRAELALRLDALLVEKIQPRVAEILREFMRSLASGLDPQGYSVPGGFPAVTDALELIALALVEGWLEELIGRMEHES